jgi:hypothetical protein
MQFVQLLQQRIARFTRLAHFAPLSPLAFTLLKVLFEDLRAITAAVFTDVKQR